jgi:hypothetical protein
MSKRGYRNAFFRTLRLGEKLASVALGIRMRLTLTGMAVVASPRNVVAAFNETLGFGVEGLYDSSEPVKANPRKDFWSVIEGIGQEGERHSELSLAMWTKFV